MLSIGDLAVGASGDAVFAVTVDSDVLDYSNSILNTAHVTDDGSGGPDLNPEDNFDDEITPLEPLPSALPLFLQCGPWRLCF